MSRTASGGSSVASLASLVLLTCTFPTYAGDTRWNVQSGDWDSAGNWTAGIPESDDVAFVRNGGTASISGEMSAVSATLFVGHSQGQSGQVTQSGGTNSPGGLYVGYGEEGTYLLSAGELSVSGSTIIGYEPSGDGDLTQSGGTVSVSRALSIGAGYGSGTYNLNGGTCEVTEDLVVGKVGSSGYMGISGTATCTVTEYLYVGQSEGTGTLELKSSDVTLQVGDGLQFGTNSTFSISDEGGATITMTGCNSAVEVWNTDSDDMDGFGRLTLVFEGAHATGTKKLELAGKDEGLDASAFDSDNFVLDGLQVGKDGVGQWGGPVRLEVIDDFDNQPGWVGDEVLYVNTLDIQQDGTFDQESVDDNAIYYKNGGDPKRLYMGDATLDGMVN